MKKPKYLNMNKRGNVIIDMAIFGIIAFVVLLLIYVVNLVWSTTYDEVLSQDTDFARTSGINDTYQNMDSWLNSWGFIFFFMIAGLVIFLVISAQSIDTHPGFFIVAIFALIIMIILMASVSNAFHDFISDESFVEQAATYSLANNIILFLPIFLLLIGGIVLIILYAKS